MDPRVRCRGSEAILQGINGVNTLERLLERGTWAPQFAHSVLSGHDRYNTLPHPPAHGTSIIFPDAETIPLS